MGEFHFLGHIYYNWGDYEKAWHKAVVDGVYVPSELEKRFMCGNAKVVCTKRGKLQIV